MPIVLAAQIKFAECWRLGLSAGTGWHRLVLYSYPCAAHVRAGVKSIVYGLEGHVTPVR